MESMECFSLKRLIDYVQHRADSAEQAAINAHLFTGCKDCNERLKLLLKNMQWLQTVVSAAAEDQSFEFSEETIAAIVAKFKEQTATGRWPIRQFFAKLIFDSGVAPEIAYGRLTKEEQVARRMHYHAEGYDIDLKFTWSNKNNNERLDGHIMSAHCDAAGFTQFKVELLQSGSRVSVTNINKHGVFKFDQLMSGTYDLKISVLEGEIHIERVSTARAA